MILTDPRPYYWPQKDKIKTYKAVREQGRRLVQFGSHEGVDYFRTVWQTDFGQSSSQWYLLSETVSNRPSTWYASVIETDFQELKRLRVFQSERLTDLYQMITRNQES